MQASAAQSPPSFVLFAAAITAGATLLGALITWLKDRNGAARRIQVLDEATKYVQFWQAAKAARETLSASDKPPASEQSLGEHIIAAERLVQVRGTYRPGRFAPIGKNLAIRIVPIAATMSLTLVVFLFIKWVNGFLPGWLSHTTTSVLSFLTTAMLGGMSAFIFYEYARYVFDLFRRMGPFARPNGKDVAPSPRPPGPP